MAEIRVERKKSKSTWVWILIAILVIVAVLWYLMTNGHINLGAAQWLGTTAIVFGGNKREEARARALMRMK